MSLRGLFLAAFFSLAFSNLASAAEKQAFTPKAFAAAQTAGQPILVEIHASWCSTCRAQHPILEELERDPKFQNLHVFQIDFDSQKEAVRSLRATMQSTLIVFNGKEERGRSVGDIDPESIADLLDKAL